MAEGEGERGARLAAENVLVEYPLPRGGKLRVLDIERLELPPGSRDSQTLFCRPARQVLRTTAYCVFGSIE